MTTITVKTNMNDQFDALRGAGTPDDNMWEIVNKRLMDAGAPADWVAHGTLTKVPNLATGECSITWSDDADA
jgi:hypothetical protein